MKARFAPFAQSLAENESKITEELLAVQGTQVDLRGYYKPDDEIAEKMMRPSETFNAALDALTKWVNDGIGPPNADYLAVSDDNSEFIYDEFGNVLGCVRTPYFDAPAAVLSGEWQSGPGLCNLSGTTKLFDSTLMDSKYTDKAGYVQAVNDALDDAVNKGFLLPADAQRIAAAASLQWDHLGI